MTPQTPFDLIAGIRRERGTDPGPAPVAYADNRSLEDTSGAIPDFHEWTPPPAPPPMPAPQTIPLDLPRLSPREAAEAIIGDHVYLSDLTGRLGNYPVKITEPEAKKIRAILVKAIRRDLRSFGTARPRKPKP